ncbi:elongation factor G [Roseospira marina]|uniref:Elongation factor G n=1 Tax=Roseospira marina TaxID=140057 RepID=A0A5M6IGH4_9PROT|nr:elongation factor G [Roseospira marina]KAA5607373.1 elongation factor G [Roseospira marina]MBB4312458.1 elongation factor G [Roseospira marina]MBB5085526.1 elongation factor G [Roseospira marina]
MPDRVVSPRVAALVGPYLSGKTSLLESLLMACGAVHRKGRVEDKNTVGDASPEARDRAMSTEVNVVEAEYLGDTWTFLDCPGSVEFRQDAVDALMVADVGVVVVDPDPARVRMAMPLMKLLDQRNIPHMIFINKIETAQVTLRELMEALQGVSDRPLVLREVPIREDGKVTGYVDLVSERAYKYRPGERSDLIQMPETVRDREEEARQELLENLADTNDQMLEELLEDVVPAKDEVYQTLTKDLAEDRVVPVFFGGALEDNGVVRLMKALRHETPSVEETVARRLLDAGDEAPLVQVFKTVHAAHTGKMSLARIWQGPVKDGAHIGGEKINGLYGFPSAGQPAKIASAEAGAVAGLGRLESVMTGALLDGKGTREADWPQPMSPLAALAVRPAKHGDDVKLSGALAKLSEEDPSLRVEQNPETNELLLWGQGDIHLQVALARLARHYNVEVASEKPLVPYQETIRKSAKKQGRFKRQTGGHGQFGDVHLEIGPLPRGAGFVFHDKITGGVVPRQYIPAVEQGVKEWSRQGPLGFPVVDFEVTLYDGSFHTVDSSEQAFKTAAQLAMREGIAECQPVLLEPILKVEISVPNDATSRAQRALSTRRGQILGFDQKEGWDGWDVVHGMLPQSEIHDLIVELRSATMGVGTFSWEFDHLQELSGRDADQVVDRRKAILEHA